MLGIFNGLTGSEIAGSLMPLLGGHLTSNLNAISAMAERLANKAHSEGLKKAGGLLDTIYLEAGQAAQGMDNPDWSRWERFVTEAAADAIAISAITPSQSSANAAPIRNRQSQLRSQIAEMGRSIGGRGSISGSLIGTSTEPIQAEWAAISKEIRNATLLASDREALMVTQRDLLGRTGDVVIKAGREGADVSKILDDLDDLRKGGLGFFKCLAIGDSKIACFMEGNRKWMTLLAVVALVGVLGVVLRPYITLFSAVT